MRRQAMLLGECRVAVRGIVFGQRLVGSAVGRHARQGGFQPVQTLAGQSQLEQCHPRFAPQIGVVGLFEERPRNIAQAIAFGGDLP